MNALRTWISWCENVGIFNSWKQDFLSEEAITHWNVSYKVYEYCNSQVKLGNNIKFQSRNFFRDIGRLVEAFVPLKIQLNTYMKIIWIWSQAMSFILQCVSSITCVFTRHFCQLWHWIIYSTTKHFVLFNTWGKQGLWLNQENVTLKRYTLLKYKKKGYSWKIHNKRHRAFLSQFTMLLARMLIRHSLYSWRAPHSWGEKYQKLHPTLWHEFYDCNGPFFGCCQGL